jgi:hypothetical protein
MKMFPPALTQVTSMRHNNNFWVLDYDPEGEIYESLSWDLPGFRVKGSRVRRRTPKQARRSHRNR